MPIIINVSKFGSCMEKIRALSSPQFKLEQFRGAGYFATRIQIKKRIVQQESCQVKLVLCEFRREVRRSILHWISIRLKFELNRKKFIPC